MTAKYRERTSGKAHANQGRSARVLAQRALYKRNEVAHAKVGTVTGSEAPRKHRAGGACGTRALIAEGAVCSGMAETYRSNGAHTFPVPASKGELWK